MESKQISEPYELSKEEMRIKSTLNDSDNPKAIIGPLFCFGGSFGLIKGVIKSIAAIPIDIHPKRLYLTSLVNITSTEVFRYANAAGGFGFVYCFTKKAINFIFNEELRHVNELKKQALYGFAAGIVFKSTRGFGPALLSGFIVGNCCFGWSYLVNKNKNRYYH